MTRRPPLAATIAAAALLLAACGGSTPGTTVPATPAGQAIVVTVSPTEAAIAPDGALRFGAQVTGTADGSVTWTVQEGSGCGSVSATGVYTAPNGGATCHVVATSVVDATRRAMATVTVTAPPPSPAIAIAINPTAATLDACASQVFTATVTNSSNTGVDWTMVDAGGGTVAGGTYVAPTTPGTYRVMAASQADPTRTVQATVTVGPERVLSVAVTPGSGIVPASGTLALSALVTTTCGTFAAQ